jgi:hypothetical protein
MHANFTVKFTGPNTIDDTDILEALEDLIGSNQAHTVAVERTVVYPYTYFFFHNSRINPFKVGHYRSIDDMLRSLTYASTIKPIGEVTIPGQRSEFEQYKLTFSVYDCDGLVLALCEGDYT